MYRHIFARARTEVVAQCQPLWNCCSFKCVSVDAYHRVAHKLTGNVAMIYGRSLYVKCFMNHVRKLCITSVLMKIVSRHVGNILMRRNIVVEYSQLVPFIHRRGFACLYMQHSDVVKTKWEYRLHLNGYYESRMCLSWYSRNQRKPNLAPLWERKSC